MSDPILRNLEDGLLTISLNRADRRNALSTPIALDLLAAVESASDDPSVRAILLRGEGGTFCVGGDVRGMAETGEAPPTLQAKNAMMQRTMRISLTLHRMAKPVVCAVDGAAAGAGLSLALACDFRVVGETAKITTSFAKMAVSGDYGGIYYLARMLGSAKARELCLLCPVLSGREAHALGLVTRLVRDDEVQPSARELALSLARGPTAAIGHLKANINDAETASLETYLDAEALRQCLCLQTDDHKEAARAFIAKRAPCFTGR